MSRELKLNSFKTMTKNEKAKIDQHIVEIIENNRQNSVTINTLVLDSITMLTVAESRSKELANQKGIKKLWGEVSGLNQSIRADIDKNHTASQYAASQMIQKLADQNMMTVDMIALVNKKMNELVGGLDDEINEIYLVLGTYFNDIKNYLEKQDRQFDVLEKRVREQNRTKGSVCVACETKVRNAQVICHQCGEMLKNPEFTSADIRDEYMEKLRSLASVIRDDSLSIEYMWDHTVENYARVIKKTKSLLSTDLMSERVTEKMFKDLDRMLERCSSNEFHIALVGAIKAGKSTLMNAVLGSDLASTRVTPETAALTKFRSSKGSDYVKVSFYTSTEWENLWESANSEEKKGNAAVFLEDYNRLKAESEKAKWISAESITIDCSSRSALKSEIEKWTSSQSPTHYFVKEVEVGLKDFNMPTGVVFVDTPGLDDVVPYRSEITRSYIDRANAVLVCVKSDKLTGPELRTISRVFSNTRFCPQKVYIVATQLDALNNPKNYWEEIKVEWLKYLKGSDFFGNPELASKNLIPVSAHLFSLMQDLHNISEADDRHFDLSSALSRLRIRYEEVHNRADEIISFTGIEMLKGKLSREIVENHKSLLLRDIKENFTRCKRDLTDFVMNVQRNQEEILSISDKGIDMIRSKSNEYKLKLIENENEKREMEELLNSIRTESEKRATNLALAIKGMAK